MLVGFRLSQYWHIEVSRGLHGLCKGFMAKGTRTFVRFTLLLVAAFLTIFGFVFQQPFQAASPASRRLQLFARQIAARIPYQPCMQSGTIHGGGLNPEDQAIGTVRSK